MSINLRGSNLGEGYRKYVNVCQGQNGRRSKNKLSGLEGTLLTNCERIWSGFSADLQRILHAPSAVECITRSQEIVRRKVGSGRAELPGQGSGDHEDAPKPLRANFYFYFLYRYAELQPRAERMRSNGRITSGLRVICPQFPASIVVAECIEPSRSQRFTPREGVSRSRWTEHVALEST